jgi:hypothetical protein
MRSVIVTGGFRHSGKQPTAISTDVAALARRKKCIPMLDAAFTAVTKVRILDAVAHVIAKEEFGR